MKIEVQLQAKSIKVFFGALAILLLLFPQQVSGSFSMYFWILYIGGFMISSNAFSDLHTTDKAYFYLTLPCSNLERLLSKWLYTSIGYALSILIFYYLFVTLLSPINLLIFRREIVPLNIFDANLWINIGKYVILQSIVLLGAITFKRQILIKTALAFGSLLLILSIFTFIVTLLFCPHCNQEGFIFFSLLQDGHFIFWLVVAPICWYMTYLRLTEYELK
ncbi:MAG: hypothetical protein HWD59_04760 [Coxiellaceae bacterium]|nr:MAG: hypothetical protein HWD59_04760 [Coxiellaceae bacterium]